MSARRVATASLLVLIACTTDPASAPLLPVVTLSVSGTTVDGVYLVASARQFTVSTLGPGSTPLDGRYVSWRSTAPTVATISADGLLAGLALGTGAVLVESEGVRRVLPVSVREGVAVPSTGAPAAATVLSGRLTMSVPTGVAPVGTLVHARVPTTWPADDRLVAATHVEIGPEGTELAAPVRVGVGFDPTLIPAIERPALRVFAVRADGTWGELPNGSVDLGSSRVSADLSRLSTIAIVRRSTATQLVKLAGDNQSATRGTTVAIAPSVVVRDAQGRPVSGITVTFNPGAGGGMVTGIAAVASGLDGVATLPGAWRLGSSAGAYTLVATTTGGLTATFNATALP